MAFHPTEPGGVVRIYPAGSADAFGRFRVSTPYTLWDSKIINADDDNLYWDDQETSGSGTSSTYNTNQSQVTLAVSDSTAGVRRRQSYMHMPYQPGKSQLILLTGILSASGAGTGITTQLGYGNGNNGLYFENAEGTFRFVRKTFTSGAAVENATELPTKLPNGTTIDLTKVQVFWIDFAWLGVSRIRCGVVGTDGSYIQLHEESAVNTLTTVYMSVPNLPIFYQIENDGNGGAASMTQICSSVMSEGAVEPIGTLRHHATHGTHVDADAADTVYAILGIRLKSTHHHAVVQLVSMSMINQQNQDFEWELLWNPTVAGTFTYSDETNSAVQTATGATANTVTGGTELTGGMVKSSNQAGAVTSALENALRLGSAIDGTVDEIVLCARPLAANADIEASLNWRELL